jgi:hypothetical protein
MIDRTHEKLNTLALLILIAALLLISLVIVLSDSPADDRVVSHEVKARMAYHGVDVVYEDWDGNLYFYREGERCEL